MPMNVRSRARTESWQNNTIQVRQVREKILEETFFVMGVRPAFLILSSLFSVLVAFC